MLLASLVRRVATQAALFHTPETVVATGHLSKQRLHVSAFVAQEAPVAPETTIFSKILSGQIPVNKGLVYTIIIL